MINEYYGNHMYLLQKLKGDFTTGKEYCVLMYVKAHAHTCKYLQKPGDNIRCGSSDVVHHFFSLCCEGDTR